MVWCLASLTGGLDCPSGVVARKAEGLGLSGTCAVAFGASLKSRPSYFPASYTHIFTKPQKLKYCRAQNDYTHTSLLFGN